jgi:hypothetical protein
MADCLRDPNTSFFKRLEQAAHALTLCQLNGCSISVIAGPNGPKSAIVAICIIHKLIDTQKRVNGFEVIISNRPVRNEFSAQLF